MKTQKQVIKDFNKAINLKNEFINGYKKITQDYNKII
jgi:hypothetical protein